MDWITGIYLVYSFLAFYFLFLFILLYVNHRKDLFKIPKVTKEYSLSCVIPCYNEEKSIGKTIESIAKNGYKNLKKIIVVDDCSKDNSLKVIKSYEKKYPGLVLGVQTPKNTGNAAGAKNYGSKFVKTELVVFTDADSFPEKGAIRKMIGYFDEENVAAVTSSILVKNRNNLLLRMQNLEYLVIKFSRKLLGYIDSIYVTPGPLAMYRTKTFFKIGMFDEKNLTEDIEITWRLLGEGYGVKMSLPSRVYSIAPNKVKDWIKQRIRWNLGGVQTILKHKGNFLKKGLLGFFVLPLFVLSWVLGVLGLLLLLYRGINWIRLSYLSTSYSIGANATVFSIKGISLNPDILFFFGMILFLIGLFFTLVSVFHESEKKFKSPRFVDIVLYMTFYLLIYPVLVVSSIYKFMRGNYKW